ncbi:hypothetical protein L3X38_043633 [Prunus dulcis]|uniref:TIR domain-containing protein n=1 Tax=Prunus dulcis TaxID=3755 RepID=A0AAD4UYS9_PRUDU|nr:hypothetical protein L3X38_043633 [Prunus dulcis]
MASSSSSSSSFANPPAQKYDVFISFRGADTRDTFTSHLHAALVRKKIQTYMDCSLEKGHKIGPSLLQAIEESKLSLIVFSKNYAFSTWCLDELMHILGCQKSYGQIVIPIFYDTDPYQVRKQHESYGDAFAQLEERFEDNMDKVLMWRNALKEAANISGFDNSKRTGAEADFIEEVAEDVLTKLNRASSSDLEDLDQFYSRKIEEVESLLCLDSPDVRTVGIWVGSLGRQFGQELADHPWTEANFVEKVVKDILTKLNRKSSPDLKGLVGLKWKIEQIERLLCIDSPNVCTVGSTYVRERLSNTKILIVLDDVSASTQLELLVGDHFQFGSGTRIIITTRDRRLLKEKVDDDKIYKVEGLSYDEARELFHLHALKNNSTEICYTKLVKEYAGGMPLALKILGSLFLHCDNNPEWEDELNNLKKFPNQEVENMLRLSYDGLEKNAKEIFLDIACFYKGMKMDFAKEILHIRGLFAGGIKDVYGILRNNTGTVTVQAIFFNISKSGQLRLDHADFKKIQRKWLLKEAKRKWLLKEAKRKWLLKEAKENLVELRMCGSKVEQLWNKDQNVENLKVMDLRSSTHLIKVPDLSQSRKMVHINLFGCTSLVQIPSYFQCLDKLTHLDLGDCLNLKYLPQMPGNIEFLNFSKTAIEELPSSVWSHEKISYLDI